MYSLRERGGIGEKSTTVLLFSDDPRPDCGIFRSLF